MIARPTAASSTLLSGALIALSDWPSTSFFTAATTSWDWGMSVLPVLRGPQYGWYSEFDPWPEVRSRPRELLLSTRPRRAQARRCIKTARKWKRRRFVQSLRRRKST